MPDIEGAHIKITGDTSQAVSEIQKLSSSLENVKSSHVNINVDGSEALQEIQEINAAVESIENTEAVISADGSQAIEETNKAAEAAESINDIHTEITADSSQAVDEVNKVSDAADNINDTHLDVTADTSQAVDEINEVSEAVQNVPDAEIQITADSSSFMNELQNVLEGIRKANEQFAREQWFKSAQPVHVNVDTSSWKQKFSELAEGMEGISRKFESGFSKAIMAVGAKITAIIGSMYGIARTAWAIGGGFEAQMTSVKIISGATGQEFDELTKKAREMGAALPISAKEAAMAMTSLAQRGTSAKDILASVSDVANLAISQGVDMGTAADLMGSTMTNFGIAIQDANKVTNIFNNASNQSAMNISKLVEALKYVGPAAGSVGMELTEAVSAMEALANSGLTGEMVGTGLSMVISKLASNSRVLGVSTKDLNGKLRPLKDIFTELQAKGFSLAEATALFGQRGNKAALALAKNSQSLAINEERLKQWGATQSAVDQKAKTFPNTMAAFRSAVEELHIEIFEQIKEQSKGAVSGIADFVRALSAWVEKTKIAEKSLKAFVEGLGFSLPSSNDFRRLLDSFDVQAFVDRMRGFGQSLHDIGEAIVSLFNTVSTPLGFLIEHLETFAKISFWAWIIDKGLLIPSAIINIATAFTQLWNVLKLFSVSALAPLLSLLANPVVLAGVAATAAVGAVGYSLWSNKKAEQAKQEKIDTEEQLKRTIEQDDRNAAFDFDVHVKTGFEDIPASYYKASDLVRQNLDDDLAFMQNLFKQRIHEAVQSVNPLFENIEDKFLGTAEGIPDDLAAQISRALQGNNEEFQQLPDFWKKVTEQLYDMGVHAGKAKTSIDALMYLYKNFKQSINKPDDKQKSEFEVFNDEINGSISALLKDFPAALERSKQFLNGSDYNLAVQVSLEQAQNQLQEFSKSIADKYSIPENIVSANLITRLKDLAGQGNKTASSLMNGWKGANNSLDTFLQNAHEAISYLGASPEHFAPALQKLTNGIQKIDPITGKVTEQFKKAYQALKEWSNITFDQLSQRIQRLRKAVESGFIDQSALEREFKDVSEQLKVKVVTELEQDRGMFKSQSAFESVVASEFISRLGEIGGETFINMARKQFEGQSGTAIGRTIINQAQHPINYNTPEQKSGGLISIQGISQTLNPMEKFPQGIFQKQDYLNYSGTLSQIINEIKGIRGAISAVENAVKSYIPDNSQLIIAVRSVEAAVKAITTGNNYNIDINQQGFVVGDKSDADNVALYTLNAIRSGIGNGGV